MLELSTGVEPTTISREQVLERLRERIVRFAASRYQGAAAEDLAQEVLLVLHEKYPHLDRAEDLVPLGLEIARLKLWAARRKTVRRGEHTQVGVDDLPLASGEPDPLDEALHQEQIERLERAMLQLGDRCRTLFRLKLEGLKFPEIAQKMGAASLNTVYTWDFRCRQQLQQILNPVLNPPAAAENQNGAGLKVVDKNPSEGGRR